LRQKLIKKRKEKGVVQDMEIDNSRENWLFEASKQTVPPQPT
jgi:hypothetical protein